MATPDWEAIETAYRAGMSLRDIAAKFGVGVKAIRYRAKKYGWEVSPDAAKKNKKTGAQEKGTAGAQKDSVPQKKLTSKASKSPHSGEPSSTPHSDSVRVSNSHATPEEFGISDQQAKFAQLVVDGKYRVAAYREAGYEGEGATAYSNASRMLRNARVSRYVHHLRNERQKRYAAELDDVIGQLTAIINADPNEISQYRRVNCRYCWGHEHNYQWRDIAEQLASERKAESDGVAPPDTSGGIGFVDNTDPNPDCPRCNGEGIGEAFFADTRDVEGDARYLLHGVKLGKFGIEILTADKDSARKELARLIILRATSDRQSQLDIERLELQNEKLRHEIELLKDGDKDNAIVVHNALPIPGR